MSSLRNLCSSPKLAECGGVSGSAELLLRAVSGQLCRHCLVLNSADVETGQIAKPLAEAVCAAPLRPVVIVVSRANSFSEVFSDISMPAVLQDSLNIVQPLHVALLVPSGPHLEAVSQYSATVEASSSLDVEVLLETGQKHTFSLRLSLQHKPKEPIEVSLSTSCGFLLLLARSSKSAGRFVQCSSLHCRSK